jgi:signal peptidase II
MPYILLTLGLVAVDQLVKYLVLQNISLGAHVPFLPGLVELTYVQNTGAAFSLFSQHTWLLALVSLAVSVVLAWAIWKNFFHHPLGKIALTLLLAGALGNWIDRAFRGFVVDMFNVLFMNFAVFNVADICVVVGGIGAGLYYLCLAHKLEPQAGGN